MKRNVRLFLIILIFVIALSFVFNTMIIYVIASFIAIPVFAYIYRDRLRSERNPLGSFGSPDNWGGHNDDDEYDDDEYERDDRY